MNLPKYQLNLYILAVSTCKQKLKCHLQLLNKVKHLGINLAKHVQNFYAENYKIPMKEVKQDVRGETYRTHR